MHHHLPGYHTILFTSTGSAEQTYSGGKSLGQHGTVYLGSPHKPPQSTVSLMHSASCNWGCAALYSNLNTPACWFQIPWPTSSGNWNIAAKELVPIVAAAAIWGKQWARSRVQFNCDNMAVVSTISSGSA